MPIRRVFLGFEHPAIRAAATWLAEQFTRHSTLDLKDVTVVVPGSRAGRHLRAELVERADAGSLALLPPRIVTAGELPEQLYGPRQPLADDLTQQLAWTAALRRCEPAALRTVVPHPPEEDDLEAWLALGQLLMRLHTELAGDSLNFDDVLKKAASLAGFDERPRWKALGKLQKAYLDTLDAASLWDRQTARLYAIKHKQIRCDGQLVLLGTVDINQAFREMLDLVSDQVTSLIFAPPEWADRFDEHGCLLPQAWHGLPLAIRGQQIRMADDAVDQADAVARELAAFDGRYRADEVAIGVPDPGVVPQLVRQMAECGVAVRWSVGRELSRSGPYRMLAAVAQLIERGRFADFAALVRHPDIEKWLRLKGTEADYLAQLDEYYADHLPARFTDTWLGSADRYDRIQPVAASIRQLAGPLLGSDRAPAEWTEAVLGVLRTVYGGNPLNREDPHEQLTFRCLEAIRDAAVALGSIPAAVAPRIPAADAVRWILSAIARASVAPPPNPLAIEMLGWLELPWDDSRAVIVTSFNEGFIPEPTAADPFLPNRLRAALGIWDNSRRYARDAYYLSVLADTRAELTLIVARRDGDNNPLMPSRLLFAAESESLVQRAEQIFTRGVSVVRRAPLAGGLSATRDHSGFVVPRPRPGMAIPASLPVTAFRSYLACPYRFYLQHILRLAPLCDNAEELDGAGFGSLLHEVLDRFGRADIAKSTDAEKIRDFLLDTLTSRAKWVFGSQPLAPVAIQVAQLKTRLTAFAAWQARWAQQGYRIAYSEVASEKSAAVLEVDGKPLGLTGRIDRIDVHEATGEHIVLDYKSSSSPDPPEKTHLRGGEWVDLQLPLYRHLVRAMKIEGPLKLGYVAISKDVTKVGHLLAGWDEPMLDAADEAARTVVRNIRDGVFWPPADLAGGMTSDFAAICQEDVFDPQLEPEVNPLLGQIVQQLLDLDAVPAESAAPKKRGRRREAAS